MSPIGVIFRCPIIVSAFVSDGSMRTAASTVHDLLGSGFLMRLG
jgi:hypothetical protein